MKPERRKVFAKLIAEEVADNIRTDESIRRKLEMLTDLPVERVVEELVKQIDYLLTKQVREIVEGVSEPENDEDEKHILAGGVGYLVTETEEEEEEPLNEEDLANLGEEKTAKRQDVQNEETFEDEEAERHSVLEEEPVEEVEKEEEGVALFDKEEELATVEKVPEKEEQKVSAAVTEPSIKKGLANVLAVNDWVYVYGFGGASKSARPEFRATNLKSKGIDGEHHVYLLDAADVSMYVSKISEEDYFTEKSGKLVITPQKAREYQYQHEWILNKLRSANVIVPLPFWTLVKGTDALARLLTSEKKDLIDAAAMLQGTREWKVEVLALDTFLCRLPEIIATSKGREASETKHKNSSRIDIKVQEKVLFREKSLATEIYEKLSKVAADGKLLQSAGLQSAFLDDWKPILLARYTLQENYHLQFCKAVTALQDEYSTYQLMIRTTNPSVEFTFPL